jgi:HK97 family phage portal protein
VGILDQLIQRRGMTVANPDSWLIRAFGGGTTDAGVHVTESTALGSSAIWAGTRLISESLSTVPLHVYQMQPDGSRRVAREHPVDELLYSAPNPEQTAQEWRSQMMASTILSGNQYNEIVRDNAQRVRQIWPLAFYRVDLKRGIDQELYYEISTTGLDSVADRPTSARLRSRQVLHIRGFNSRGLLGDSMVNRLRQTIGISLATEEFGAKFYGQGTQLSGVVSHPGTLSEPAQKRFRDSWTETYSGLSNAHRVAILEEGMKWDPISIPPEAAQFLETRQFQIQEVARALNLPPHMLRDLSRATFSNVEQQAIEFVVHTLRPWAVILEQRMGLALLTEQERRDGYYIRHTLEGLLRGDLKTRYDSYAIGRNWGWLSANDIRALEDLNPIGDGDIYLQPLNMVPAGTAPEIGVAEADEPDLVRALRACGCGNCESHEKRTVEKSDAIPEAVLRNMNQRRKIGDVYKSLIASAVQTIVQGEVRALRKQVTENLRGVSSMTSWAEGFYGPEFKERLIRVVGPIIRAYQQQMAINAQSEIGGDDPWPQVQNWVESYLAAMASRYAGLSQSELIARLEAADPEKVADEINALADQWEESRAADVANEETVRAGQGILRVVWGALGVVAMQWVASSDPCEFCQQINGRVVGIASPFTGEGTELVTPGGNSIRFSHHVLHPPLHRGCQCNIVPR